MRKYTSVALMLAIALTFSSCISKKKHEEALSALAAAEAAKQAALEKQLDDERAAKERLQAEISKLESNLNMSKADIQKLSEEIKVNNRRIESLRKAIADVFSGIDKMNYTITERDGKLYISLANSILFKAGEAAIKDEGAQELVKNLAAAFNSTPDLNIVVEGHTDSDPLRTHKAKYEDNWLLSTARATSVVRMLVGNGMSATRLTASGRGEHQPTAGNTEKADKEKNRRTEFIVTPPISGLYKMYKEEIKGATTPK